MDVQTLMEIRDKKILLREALDAEIDQLAIAIEEAKGDVLSYQVAVFSGNLSVSERKYKDWRHKHPHAKIASIEHREDCNVLLVKYIP